MLSVEFSNTRGRREGFCFFLVLFVHSLAARPQGCVVVCTVFGGMAAPVGREKLLLVASNPPQCQKANINKEPNGLELWAV